MQNFITLGQPLPGEKYVAEKKKKNKNNTKYSGHFVPQQRPRAAHALRSDQNFAMNTIEETIDTPAPYMTEEECHAGYSDDDTSNDNTEKEESQSVQIIQNRCEEYKFTTIVDRVDVRIEMGKKSDQSECINNENHEIYI